MEKPKRRRRTNRRKVFNKTFMMEDQFRRGGSAAGQWALVAWGHPQGQVYVRRPRQQPQQQPLSDLLQRQQQGRSSLVLLLRKLWTTCQLSIALSFLLSLKP